MKTVILALCLFSAAFALSDQEKLASFIEGLDFGIGATSSDDSISKEGALSLFQASNSDEFNEFKALEHELLNGLAYAQTLEVAIAHIRIVCDILHTQILDKYMAQSGMTPMLYKWNKHIDSLFRVNEMHLAQQQAILYNYELLFQFQEGNYRLAGFNLGQFMRFVLAASEEIPQTQSA